MDRPIKWGGGGHLRYARRGLNSFSMPEKHEKITPVLQAITDTSITGVGDPKFTLYLTYVNSTWA